MMKNKKPLSAIILASEITKGMKSIGSKALLPIAGSITLIDYQIQFLKRFYNPIEIYICTGFDHDKIVKKTQKYKDIKYIYNKNYAKHNQMDSLLLCLHRHNLDHAFIINNGVLISEKLCIGNHTEIFTINSTKKIEFGIGCNISGSHTNYLFYDLPNKWIECAFINKDTIKFLLEYSKIKDISKLFLFEGLNIISENTNSLKTTELDKTAAIKVNNIKDLSKAKKYYEKYICSKHI
jgi:GTP:adenosylcobinamide-phosphate guanylyltransferase